MMNYTQNEQMSAAASGNPFGGLQGKSINEVEGQIKDNFRKELSQDLNSVSASASIFESDLLKLIEKVEFALGKNIDCADLQDTEREKIRAFIDATQKKLNLLRKRIS